MVQTFALEDFPARLNFRNTLKLVGQDKMNNVTHVVLPFFFTIPGHAHTVMQHSQVVQIIQILSFNLNDLKNC